MACSAVTNGFKPIMYDVYQNKYSKTRKAKSINQISCILIQGLIKTTYLCVLDGETSRKTPDVNFRSLYACTHTCMCAHIHVNMQRNMCKPHSHIHTKQRWNMTSLFMKPTIILREKMHKHLNQGTGGWYSGEEHFLLWQRTCLH